jgi:HEAT repeat protein
MNTLLRYLLFNVAIKIVLIEMLVMLLFVLLIVIVKIYNKRKAQRIKKLQDAIAASFDQVLFGETTRSRKEEIERYTLPEDLYSFRDLIEVCETFDQRYRDPNWQKLKRVVFEKHLFEEAKESAYANYWFNRQLAGRAFLLNPKMAPVEALEHLLSDKRFLVRIAAAICITKTPYKGLFIKVVEAMANESSLSQFPYRDAIIDSDQEKFVWLVELLQTAKIAKITNVCIDLLSTRTIYELPDLVEKYLTSPNKESRLLAIKALGSVPSEKSMQLLVKHLEDSDWEMRAESLIGLRKLHVQSAAREIEPLLGDPSWWVRQQAAMTLKSFGEEGQAILRSQSQEKKPLAYEISQYILALP